MLPAARRPPKAAPARLPDGISRTLHALHAAGACRRSRNKMSRPAESEGYVRPAAQEEDEIDLRAYWRVIVRRRWVILGVFAAAVLLTLLFTLRQTKIYAATTTLIIDLNAPRVLNKEDVQEVVESGTGGYWYSKEYYETQYKVITSRAVAQRVIDKLQLARDLRFLGLDGEKDQKKLDEALAKTDPALVLQERLKVLPVKDSRVVRIQVEDRDPTWAATLANAVAEAYITENLSVRSSMTHSASDWLEQQLADLEAKLSKSADDLFAFKQKNDIVATSWEDRQSMVSQRLVAVNDALTKARVTRAQLESRSEQIEALSDALAKGDPATEAFAIVNQSRTVQDLKVRYFEAKVECADMTARYLDDHPKLAACEAKLAAAREGLAREVRTILDGARREYQEAVQTERKLSRLLDETKADAFGLNQHEKAYLELKRTHDNNQRLYELVLQRLKETGVTGMMQMSNVRVLDRAEAPDKPIRPRPLRNVSLAVLLSLLVGVGLSFLLDYLDVSITSREQVEERLGLALLGIIPGIKEAASGPDRDLYVHSNPRSVAAECLRSIRTNLLFMSPDKPLKTIVITSSGPGEGKTTTAATLAATMADSGNRVLVIDADMRRPRLHRVFGVQNTAGLSTLILGEGRPDELIHPTSIPNLFVLPCGPIPPNPAELLHTAAFDSILVDLAKRFDRIIIDSPPAGVVADAIVVSARVDGTLIVLKGGETSRDAAARTIRSLLDVKARILGAVLNNLDLEDQRYGSYYHYSRYGYYAESADASRAQALESAGRG
jgi:succinoglycan biosynthesis transport protein ExoP